MSLLRASILGGVDGVITSFAVVAGGFAGGASVRDIGIVGSSSVIADGISMGISEFLSSTTERASEEGATAAPAARRTTLERRRPTPMRAAPPRHSPSVLGVVCFVSFVVCGTVPLATFLASSQSILACAFFTASELMALGAARTLASGEFVLRGLLQTFALGAVAGSAAYAVGYAAHAVA